MSVVEHVGFRNQMRARWRALPEQQRLVITIVVEVLVSVLFWLVDPGLGYAVALIFIALWLRRMQPAPVAARDRGGGGRDLRDRLDCRLDAGRRPARAPRCLRDHLDPGGLEALGRSRSRCVLVAFAYPFVAARLFTIPVFGPFPDVASGTGTYMMVFMMMAVGLNIVVGYAGLLDLGYVAFYAIGAYVIGWFASSQFQGEKCANPHFSVDNCPCPGRAEAEHQPSAGSAFRSAPAASTSRSSSCS